MPQAARGKYMKMHQIAGMVLTAMLGMQPSHAGSAAQDSVMRDDTVRITDTQAWHESDLPYMRLLADPPALAPHWSITGGTRQGANPAVLAQQANVIPPVHETSMYSMLLVGLGLLALCVPRDKQEKFDQGR